MRNDCVTVGVDFDQSRHINLQISIVSTVKLEHPVLMAMLAKSGQNRFRTDFFK